MDSSQSDLHESSSEEVSTKENMSNPEKDIQNSPLPDINTSLQNQKNPEISNLVNINEEIVKVNKILSIDTDLSLIGQGAASLDVNDDDIDNLNDSSEIIDEDALLKDDMELNDITIIQAAKTSVTFENQDISHEKSNKNDLKNLEKEKTLVDIVSVDEYRKVRSEISYDEYTPTNSQDMSFERITEHGLNKPDMMLEIPTQEFIEFSDEDDDESENNSHKMSTDVEDITDLEESYVDKVVKDELMDHTDDNVDNLVDINITEPKPDALTMEATVDNHESSKDVNMDVLDNDKIYETINSLSNEAEIADNIITKELNSVKEGGSIQDNMLVDDIKPIENDLNSEKTNKSILRESGDVIELSDNNVENEQGINVSLLTEPLPIQDVISEKAFKAAILEDDTLNDIEEIDNLILSTKISKTKITRDDSKITHIMNKNITTLSKTMSEPNIELDVSKSTIGLDSKQSDSQSNKNDTLNEIVDTESINKTDNLSTNEMSDNVLPDNTTQKDVTFCVNTSAKSLQSVSNSEAILFEKIPTEKNKSDISKGSTSDLVTFKNKDLKVSESETEINSKDNFEQSVLKTSEKDTNDIRKSMSIIESNISKIDEPQPSTSKVELQTSDLKMSDRNESLIIQPKISNSLETQLSLTIESQTSEMSETCLSRKQIESKTLESIKPIPSTSRFETQTLVSYEPKPSTSKCDLKPEEPKHNSSDNQLVLDSLVLDTSNDVPDVTDSLGLLAESSRVVDDEEHDDDEHDDYGEDEDDFEPDDESSNQMTTEHSEDSNAHHSESDGTKDVETPNSEKQEFNFKASESLNVKEKNTEPDEDQSGEIPKGTENEEAIDLNSLANKVTGRITQESDTTVMETVKLSDSSDTEDNEKSSETNDSSYEKWAKTKKLSISKQQSVVSFVDLEESSSDEDKNQPQTKAVVAEIQAPEPNVAAEGVSSDVPHEDPTEVAMVTETETTHGSPAKDLAKTNEVIAAKVSSPKKDVAAPSQAVEDKVQSSLGPVFNLDSDEEDSSVKQDTDEAAANADQPTEEPELRVAMKCINRSCTNKDPCAAFYVADSSTAKYFETEKKKRIYVCEMCAKVVEKRNQELIEGIKNYTPLLELRETRDSQELVEISDSDSDEEEKPDAEFLQFVGEEGAKMLEEKLASLLNDTWEKYYMDFRIAETQAECKKQTELLEKESAELEVLFKECQEATDKLRNSLYSTFDSDIQELPPIIIYDMPNCSYSTLETTTNKRRQNKRSLSTSKETAETPAKKVSLSGFSEETSSSDNDLKSLPATEKTDDDNTDISVVKLSVEVAPADLPPPGDLSHPPVKVGMTVYAMKNAFGTWLRAKVVEVQPKTHTMPFTMVRVRFEHKMNKNPFKTLSARCLAYSEPPDVRMVIGTRVIALFKDDSSRQSYYSGIVAEIPNPVNNYRYLIFFDDGYAQYAAHPHTRLVCESSALVWEEVHSFSREFVRTYLLAYPERPMVRLHAGQNLQAEWRGDWCPSRVLSVDASLVEVQFLDSDRREWIYRGSTRLAPLYMELQAAGRHRSRALPRTQPQAKVNMPYVEYTRSDDQVNKQPVTSQQRHQQQYEEMRRLRAVAKKSTSLPASNNANVDVTSRVIYYTPKNAVKPLHMTRHTCSSKCKRTDVLPLSELRTYNPLAKPLLSGWERQVVRWRESKRVMYVAPCGRRLRNMRELHRYLRITQSDMPVDLFDFSASTHCLAEFLLNKCLTTKRDLSHGKELVPVPCVNYYDDSLPEFCSYNTERTPTAGVPLNLDPEFLCGCDCEDDCENKKKCACWKMTLEGARTIGYKGDVGYVYRRLPEPLPSGIYECNSRCKCKNTCLNRVAQHPLQLKLQVFKTLNRGWGIRAMNDVPKGAFVCVYAGNLLTDATANLDGLNEGDEYLAELDYIEVVEQMKEGYEKDIPDKIKAKDKKQLSKDTEDEDEEDEESSEEETVTNNEKDDGDFEPGFIGTGVAEFSKRLRRRDSKKDGDEAKPQEKEMEKDKDANADEECITISDDEEVREPSCFTAAAGMGKNEFVSKYRSVRTLFGEDEACYIMDAKVQGNIGRYLNHSCMPNVFVQNVFVDTHDPRFPWVAFFALANIHSGTELTWNYNYDVGSVPGKVLYCFCGAQNCRGRLL